MRRKRGARTGVELSVLTGGEYITVSNLASHAKPMALPSLSGKHACYSAVDLFHVRRCFLDLPFLRHRWHRDCITITASIVSRAVRMHHGGEERQTWQIPLFDAYFECLDL